MAVISLLSLAVPGCYSRRGCRIKLALGCGHKFTHLVGAIAGTPPVVRAGLDPGTEMRRARTSPKAGLVRVAITRLRVRPLHPRFRLGRNLCPWLRGRGRQTR